MSQDESNLIWETWVAEAKATSAEAIARSRALLNETAPDTFLGRKTQEQFNSQESRRPNKAVTARIEVRAPKQLDR